MVCFMDEKGIKSFQNASFITNNFVTMISHVYLFCHPKGLIRAGTVSLLSTVLARQRAETITSITTPLQK